MTDLEIQEQVARIRNDLAESEKFVAEQRKLTIEALKLDRERVWYPWLQLLTIAASSAAIGAVVARLIH